METEMSNFEKALSAVISFFGNYGHFIMPALLLIFYIVLKFVIKRGNKGIDIVFDIPGDISSLANSFIISAILYTIPRKDSDDYSIILTSIIIGLIVGLIFLAIILYASYSYKDKYFAKEEKKYIIIWFIVCNILTVPHLVFSVFFLIYLGGI